MLMNAKKSDIARLMASSQQKYTSADEKESEYREKSAQQQERGSGRGVQQPISRLENLHQPQRDSFLDASFGSQSN